jgi:ubiquinone/menaquinone biosynthesis C-methylase UbiE
MVVELLFVSSIFAFLYLYFWAGTENEKVQFEKRDVLKKRDDFSNIPIEEVRKFWDARPCNILHSSLPVGSVEYFQNVEEKKYFVEPHIPLFAEFHRWKGKRVLELGCGIGTEAVNFARAGAMYTGVDLSSRSIELARKRFEVFHLSGEFIEGDAESLSNLFPGRTFDLIWSFGMIHHTPHPKRVIQQMKTLLDENGEVRVMLYSKVSYKLFFLMRKTGVWNFANMDKLISQYSEAQSGCPITYTFTLAQIRELFEGFEILEMRKDHIFPYEISQYRNNIFVKEEEWQGIPAETFKQLESELGWHTLVRARLKPA